jgi:hypothetical protein
VVVALAPDSHGTPNVGVPLPRGRPQFGTPTQVNRATPRKRRTRVAAVEQTAAQAAPPDALGQLLNSLFQGPQSTQAPATPPGR